MSKDWYQQSINALQLNGKGERTQQAYTRALRLGVRMSKPQSSRKQIRSAARRAVAALQP